MRRILVVIPAHNEEGEILQTCQALDSQTRPADQKMVLCDNCTDHTPQLVQSLDDWKLSFTWNNQDKKAGALNQALDKLLPELNDEDCVLILDADSYLAPDFLETAERYIDQGYHAVGGVFQGRGRGFWSWCQKNEYARYARDVKRLKGKALCLTGTAALFTVQALREVAASRSQKTVYDRQALTEDFEISLRLKHLHLPIIAPADCCLTTETMPSWKKLYKQRLRWKRGAIQSLRFYGWTSLTASYWGRQLLLLIGSGITLVYLATLLYALFSWQFHLYPIWLVITVIFSVERFITVYARGWKVAVITATLLPEMLFDTLLQLTQLSAWGKILTRQEEAWH